jgi:hypothetical protein
MVLVTAAAACNEVPVKNLATSYQVQIQELRDQGKPARLDILWVVDDSTSMCQEQQSLASSFAQFLEVFKQFTAIDMQLAVTTTNVCPKSNPGNVRGRFAYSPATSFPLDCLEKRVRMCIDDADCQNDPTLPDSQNWVCEKRSIVSMYTCDLPENLGDDRYEGDVLRTISTQCRYRCDRQNNPAQCARAFGSPDGCAVQGAGDTVSMCESGVCSAGACESNATLPTSVDCASACRGFDCADVCETFTEDPAGCASRCQAAGGSCIDVCRQVSKGPSCGAVCQVNWDCQDRCEEYLHDADKCRVACSAASPAACREACRMDFLNQDFLCFLSCDPLYNCTDRCIAEFGEPTHRCVVPSTPDAAGCLLPPQTAYCPGRTDRGPGVPPLWNGPTILNLEVADAYLKDYIEGRWSGHPDWDASWKSLPVDDDPASYEARETARQKVFELLFTCMASVGAEQVVCGLQEQGLLAAWKALDPEGENADQARKFLREDAYLLVITISDEDDCSAPEYEYRNPSTGNIELRNMVGPDKANQCPCLRDEHGCLANGSCDIRRCFNNRGEYDRLLCPLYSPETIVNRLRALKADPAQVLFTAIAGDIDLSQPGELYLTDDLRELSDRYYECKCDSRAPMTAPLVYGCLSRQGKADLGDRYKAVAQAFGLGRYGQFANICSDAGIGPALEEIANLVVPLLTKVCLPRPMEWSCQSRCENLFNDSGKCMTSCEAQDCFVACQDAFEGLPGCAEICAAGEFVEVYKYDQKGNCLKVDAAGNCLPLRQTTPGSQDGDFFLVRGAPDCVLFDVTLGERPENAIQFVSPLDFSDRLDLVYRAKPFWCQDRCNRVFRAVYSEQSRLDQLCNGLCDATPVDCIENCVRTDGAERCAYVCTVSASECIQQCEAMNAAGSSSINCNNACRD